MGFLSSYDGELREPLLQPQGSSVTIRVVSVSMAFLSSHGRRKGLQEALNWESRGLSQVVAGNPGFPLLVTVTSGSFSGFIWEVRNTVELGRASRFSTAFGEIEEGLISN